MDSRGGPAAPRLEARGVTVDFQGLRALDTVDLALVRGEILGLIGPNGAGKTTLVNVLSGFQRPSVGSVVLDGDDVTDRAPARLARLGLSRTFQNVRVFANLTVAQNVEVAALGVGMGPRAARAKTGELLKRFGLGGLAPRIAGSLPYGEERRLGLARALAAEPAYVLLDEPAAGLGEREGDELGETLRALPEQDGCGVLLIEHDMRVVMRLCHRIQVIDHGQTIAVGTPDEVRADPAVLEAYLGTGHQVNPHA